MGVPYPDPISASALRMKPIDEEIENMQIIEQESDFYEAIRRNPALRWLLRQPELVDGKDPLEWYDWVMENVKRMRRQDGFLILGVYILIIALCISMGMVFHVFKMEGGRNDVFIWGIITSVILVLSAALIFLWYYPRQEEFIGLWINAHWKTKSFYEEVDLIARNFTALPLLRGIEKLQGTNKEMRSGVIPQVVKLTCDDRLLSKVTDIRKKEPEAFPGSHKRDVCERIRIYKKYKILLPNASFEQYRQRDLQELRKPPTMNAVH